MALTLRTISTTMPLYYPDGSLVANTPVTFDLVSVGGSNIIVLDAISGQEVLNKSVTVNTDVTGNLTVALWPTSRSDSPCVYSVHVGRLGFKAPLPDGVGAFTWAMFVAGRDLSEQINIVTVVGAQGPPGSQIYAGDGEPSDALGVDGDYYIDKLNHFIFGPKALGAYPIGVSLGGPPGADGTDGTNGVDGSTWYIGPGIPSDAVGINGDFFFSYDNFNIYKKATGTWGTAIANIEGVPGEGVPVGGTANQTLSKVNGTDYNTQWVTPPEAAPAETATTIGVITHGVSGKTPPLDADEVTGNDSTASFGLVKFTWTNIKAFLKTYFDTLYPSGSGTSSGTNTGDQTGGTPAIVLGTANTAGSSPNFLRRDDTILAFDTTAPSTQAFGDAAAVGTATVSARRDHKHSMMAAPTSVSGNAGTVTTNANLTGPITSVGNATSVASQTGTGSTFVMSALPTLADIIVVSTDKAITASGQIAVKSSTAIDGTTVKDNGGQISFEGVYHTNGAITPFGTISARKRYVNNGHHSGYLAFAVNAEATGGTPTTQLTISAIADGGCVAIGMGATLASYLLQLNTDSAGKPGVGGLWTVPSDSRLKKDIVLADLELCYANIKAIPLKYFGWADGVYSEEQVKDRHNLGWIAQDVQKVFPKAVGIKKFTKNEKSLDGKDDIIEDCLDLNSGQILTTLFGCVQHLISKVESLEKALKEKSK